MLAGEFAMRWNLLLGIGLGFLTPLALWPEDESPEALRQELARARQNGFNEGYERGAREILSVVELRRLGEHYYDSVNQRIAFRWYCDVDNAVESPESGPSPSADREESPRRLTQLSLDANSREQAVLAVLSPLHRADVPFSTRQARARSQR